MPDITMGCAEVNVMNIDVPRFVLSPPSSTVTVNNPDFVVTIKNPLLKVLVERPTDPTVLILPVAGPPGPPGSGSGSGSIMLADQDPIEAPNGVRTTFTLSDSYVPDSLMVFLNGLYERHIIQLTPTSFQFTTPPEPGDSIKLTFSLA